MITVPLGPTAAEEQTAGNGCRASTETTVPSRIQNCFWVEASLSVCYRHVVGTFEVRAKGTNDARRRRYERDILSAARTARNRDLPADSLEGGQRSTRMAFHALDNPVAVRKWKILTVTTRRAAKE